jgi:hypothetical protein
LLLQYVHFRAKDSHFAVLLQKWRKTWEWSYSTPQLFEEFQQKFPDFQRTYNWLQKKKTGKENFPNVNLVLSICQLIVYLTIPIK